MVETADRGTGYDVKKKEAIPEPLRSVLGGMMARERSSAFWLCKPAAGEQKEGGGWVI